MRQTQAPALAMTDSGLGQGPSEARRLHRGLGCWVWNLLAMEHASADTQIRCVLGWLQALATAETVAHTHGRVPQHQKLQPHTNHRRRNLKPCVTDVWLM